MTFAGAVAVNFLLNLVFYILMTTMALYAIGQFRADGTVAGLTASIFVLGALITRLLATRLIVSIGPRRTFLLGAALSVVLSLAYFVASPLWVLIVVRCLHGAGFGLAHSAIGGIAQSVLPRQRRGEGTGYFATASTLGSAFGPMVGLAAIQLGGYQGMFVLVATASLVALSLAMLLRRAESPDALGAGRQQSAEADGGVAPVRLSQAKALWAILPIGSVAFVQSLAYSGVAAFAGVHSLGLGGSAATGTFFIVYASAVVLVRIFGGKVLDRHGPATVFYPSISVYLVALVLVALAPTVPVLLLGAFLLGLGYGSLLPTGQTIAVQLLPQGQSGVAFSWFFIFVDLGFGVGPLLMGFLVTLTDTRTMILISCSTVLLAGLLFRTLVPQWSEAGQ